MSEDERFTMKDGGADRLADALRRAGPRPTLSADAARRLRAATEAALERERARRRGTRRTRWWLAAAAVVALLLVARLAWMPGGTGTTTVARVERVVGAATAGAVTFALGEPIVTGREELLALRATTGHSIRLAAETRLRFTTAHRIELQQGAVYIDSDASPTDEALEVDTTFGRVEETGTRYLVRVTADALAVRVRDGQVTLQHADVRHVADAGFGLTVGTSGRVAREPVDRYGDAWQWALDAAPTPAIDGRPLEVLLDWVVRETGWTLAFDDESTALRAPDIVVHGSVEGLAPAAALEVILPTCGLTHRVGSGTLLVGALPEE